MGQTAGWQPGDPLYPEQAPQALSHCGPCLVAWTAEADWCPECGELSTEALRSAIERVRARHPMAVEDYSPEAGGPQRHCQECERPWPCREIAALDGVPVPPEPAPSGWPPRGRRAAR